MLHPSSTFDSVREAAAIIINRHWLIGLENVLITAVLGTGIVNLISKVGGKNLSPVVIVRLKRFVLLAALFKGAFYFILGLSFKGKHLNRLCAGFQFPDPREIVHLVPENPWSIWHPAPLTQIVTGVLLTYAGILLMARISVLMAASRAVAQSRLEMPPDVQNAISQELELAANQIGHPTLRSIEIIICEGIPTSSPFVLGFLNPRIVIREDMLTLLIEKKWLRSVLCHELMHIVRRDHITRWFQLWLEDITTITLVGRMVGRSAFSYEEQLCDCGAIKDTMDAEALAFAITSTLKLRLDPPLTPTFSYFVSSPFPSLKGGSSAEKRGLMNRLSHISTYAQFILEESLINPRKISLVKSLLIFILGFVLFLAIYLRYYIFISV